MTVLAKFRGEKGDVYEVREGKDGNIYCTCYSWRYSKRNPKTCKHLEKIQTALLTGDTAIFEQMETPSEWERNLGR